ncbi:MAG: hypothetical protein V3V25_13540 [Paracoccaceae bacterium]
MKLALKTKISVAAIAMIAATSATAETTEYLRKGKEIIQVSNDGGSLSCLRASDGFEMCNGMLEQADGSWKGKNMRHPAMPKFMKFNGTVVFSDAGLNIRGCAVGICKAEDWVKN